VNEMSDLDEFANEYTEFDLAWFRRPLTASRAKRTSADDTTRQSATCGHGIHGTNRP